MNARYPYYTRIVVFSDSTIGLDSSTDSGYVAFISPGDSRAFIVDFTPYYSRVSAAPFDPSENRHKDAVQKLLLSELWELRSFLPRCKIYLPPQKLLWTWEFYPNTGLNDEKTADWTSGWITHLEKRRGYSGSAADSPYRILDGWVLSRGLIAFKQIPNSHTSAPEEQILFPGTYQTKEIKEALVKHTNEIKRLYRS